MSEDMFAIQMGWRQERYSRGQSGDWDEAKHPRAGDGKFSSGGGAGKKPSGQTSSVPVAGSGKAPQVEVGDIFYGGNGDIVARVRINGKTFSFVGKSKDTNKGLVIDDTPGSYHIDGDPHYMREIKDLDPSIFAAAVKQKNMDDRKRENEDIAPADWEEKELQRKSRDFSRSLRDARFRNGLLGLKKEIDAIKSRAGRK